MTTDGEKRSSHASPPAGTRGVRVERNEKGMLVVHIAGRDQPVVNASVARCFPWSCPDINISIRDSDGKEVVMLKALAELDPQSHRIVEEELNLRTFNPKIQRVVKIKQEFEVTSITAVTDRGEVTFQLHSRDDVRVLSPTRALFRDVDGNTYELADLNLLDAASQRRLAEYF